jgi:hypothetical protein
VCIPHTSIPLVVTAVLVTAKPSATTGKGPGPNAGFTGHIPSLAMDGFDYRRALHRQFWGIYDYTLLFMGSSPCYITKASFEGV